MTDDIVDKSKDDEKESDEQSVNFLLSLLKGEAEPEEVSQSTADISFPFKEGNYTRRDISLIISSDNLRVFMSLILEHDQLPFTFEEIIREIDRHQIVHGINRKLIQEQINTINSNHQAIRNVLICEGTAPEHGQDGKIHYKFNVKVTTVFDTDSEEPIDYKELHLINNVSKGDLLATRVPSAPAIAGVDVFGKEITPPAPKVVSFVAGDNVTVSPDKNSCFAAVDGKVQLNRKIIHVSPIHIVSTDVDLRSGNINFNGSVMVLGKVLSGFTIKATKDITILGTVEAAHLIAGRNVIIKSGFIGQNRGRIQCKGDLTVKFIEAGNVECHGNLLVESSIISSQITGYQNIRFSSNKRGQIIGGNVTAVDGIICKEIGSKLGTPTVIAIGDKKIIRDRLTETTESIAELDMKLKKIKVLQSQDKEKFTSALAQLSEEQKQEIVELITNKDTYEKKFKFLTGKKSKLQILYNRPTLAQLQVKGVAHSGVEVHIGNHRRELKESIAQVAFSDDPFNKRVALKAL